MNWAAEAGEPGSSAEATARSTDGRAAADATVTVVGGGLAGLVAVRHLAAAGASVTLYERRSTVGGRVRSIREDGYVFDRGFQVLLTAYPAARRELDFASLDLRRFPPGATICRPNSRRVLADPFRAPRAAFETATNRDVTLGDKLRTLRLRRELAGRAPAESFEGPDETTAKYLDRRGFSPKFVERFAAPFFGGITLDRSLATSSRIFEFVFGMLASGHAAVPARGMQAIPEQLAARARDAGVNVETDVRVTAVDGDADGATVESGGERRSADAVVVAVDPPSARALTDLDAIPTDGRGCVTQYYALDGGVDLGRRLLLNAESEAPNEVTPVSAVAPEHAPPDVTLCSATFLGERDESDAVLAETTRRTLADWFPEREFGSLDVVHTARVPFAQFAQLPGFRERLPDARAPGGRVYLAGEYTRTSSINGALESGRDAALAVLDDLQDAA